ncbi:ApaG domain [Luteolibacter algae]|uniref:ApaG domain n=1 Tax=Luteolibacter algae TaxID=454151 RepID=A0ABW5D8V3_9BACT
MPNDIKEFEGLRVKVDDVIYMPSLDAPPERPHPFVYFISIFNNSPQPVTIRGRKWVVVEDERDTTVVEGDGVVGQYPLIEAGQHFSYNSYHVVGKAARVSGAFFAELENGELVYVRIPEFRLEIPTWA